MEYTVDRFEDMYAVCVDKNGKIFNIKKEDIVGVPKEGDVVIFSNGKYYINKLKTEERKKYIKNLTNDLWE
jgi:signal peptidase I